jgi:hypothetical protein
MLEEASIHGHWFGLAMTEHERGNGSERR